MVIDDDADARRTLREFLTREGFTVQTARDGQHALAVLERIQAPDLILLDYKMPGLTGFEVFSQARALHPDLAVVLVTGHGTPDIVDEANRLGFASILLKPFTSDELRGTVEKVFAERDQGTR